jgi:hypothetical protein
VSLVRLKLKPQSLDYILNTGHRLTNTSLRFFNSSSGLTLASSSATMDKLSLFTYIALLSAHSLAIYNLYTELSTDSIFAAIWLLSAATFLLANVKLFINSGAYSRLGRSGWFFYFGPTAKLYDLQQLQWNSNTWSDQQVLTWKGSYLEYCTAISLAVSHERQPYAVSTGRHCLPVVSRMV